MEVEELLATILEKVAANPSLFEKPTAPRFYTDLLAHMPLINEAALDHTAMKNKMSYLKSQYTKAISFRDNTGSGLLADGKENTVRGEFISIVDCAEDSLASFLSHASFYLLCLSLVHSQK